MADGVAAFQSGGQNPHFSRSESLLLAKDARNGAPGLEAGQGECGKYPARFELLTVLKYSRMRCATCDVPPEIEHDPGILLKLDSLRAIGYVDWAQTGVDTCFHGSDCTGLWGQLHGVLPAEQSYGGYDPASKPADRSWYTADFTGLGNLCEQHRDEPDYQRCCLDQQRSHGADDQPEHRRGHGRR